MKKLYYYIFRISILILVTNFVGCKRIFDPIEIVQTKILFLSDQYYYQDIYIIDSYGNNQLALTNKYGICKYPSFSNDGSKIVFQSDTTEVYSQIFVVNADGSGLKQLTKSYLYSKYPQFYPSDDKILFYSMRPENNYVPWLYSMNVDGMNQTKLIEYRVEPYFKFVPNESRIVYNNSTGNYSTDIYIMESDGSNQINLTENEDYWYTDEFNISSDGEKIVYVQVSPVYKTEIFIMNIDGTDKIQLTHSGQNESPRNPIFSPDNKKILYINSNRNISYMMNIDGSNILKLSEHINQWTALFDPDGKSIYYSNLYGENSQIYKMNLSNQNQIRLTDLTGKNFPVDVYR